MPLNLGSLDCLPLTLTKLSSSIPTVVLARNWSVFLACVDCRLRKNLPISATRKWTRLWKLILGWMQTWSSRKARHEKPRRLLMYKVMLPFIFCSYLTNLSLSGPPPPVLRDNFRDIQVKVHIRRPERDSWVYMGRGLVTQEVTGHSSRVGAFTLQIALWPSSRADSWNKWFVLFLQERLWLFSVRYDLDDSRWQLNCN